MRIFKDYTCNYPILYYNNIMKINDLISDTVNENNYRDLMRLFVDYKNKHILDSNTSQGLYAAEITIIGDESYEDFLTNLNSSLDGSLDWIEGHEDEKWCEFDWEVVGILNSFYKGAIVIDGLKHTNDGLVAQWLEQSSYKR